MVIIRPIAAGALDVQRRTTSAANLPTVVEIGADVVRARAAANPLHRYRAIDGGDQRAGASHINTIVIRRPIAAGALDVDGTTGGLHDGVGVDGHTVVIGSRIQPLTQQTQAARPRVVGAGTAAGAQINSAPI